MLLLIAIAVNMDKIMPRENVSANPRIIDVPNPYNTNPVIRLEMFDAEIELHAALNPSFSENGTVFPSLIFSENR